jgi:alpha-D-ribose 1-methylphosphonate 5-triphosphate synthase subunit PhnH
VNGAPGFADPVHDAQRAFRAVLAALSRPGRAVDLCAAGAPAFAPLCSATTALLLTLTDESTPVWWPGRDAATTAAAQALRFHTGAAPIADAADAAFAVIGSAGEWPAFDSLANGSDAFPERSTTLVIEARAFGDDARSTWSGPGIEGSLAVRIAGLPEDFVARWAANRAVFPRGVDIVFTCGSRAIGLPRSTRVA